jgi:hypothetical protein
MYRQIWWLSASAIGGMMGPIDRATRRTLDQSRAATGICRQDALDSELARAREDFSVWSRKPRECQSLEAEAAPPQPISGRAIGR